MKPMLRSLLSCRALWFAAFVIGVAPLALPAAGGATITYRRVFKGSNPEFIEIKLPEDGAGTYDIRQLSEDADPEPLDVNPTIKAKVLELAAALHNFDGVDLDVHRKIADLGEKTFKYENGGETHEAHFNYTLNRTATQLALIFEGLSQQQQDLMTLEQKLKYDRLGVNDALRQFENDLGQRSLPEPERLLPVLDRIGADSRVIEMARQRARALAERIRTSQDSPPSAPSGK
jgi:hypothetical protein